MNQITNRNRNAGKYVQQHRIHRNCIRFGSGDFKHELSKFVIAFIIAKGGDVKVIFPLIKDYLENFADTLEVSQALEEWCFSGNEREFLTEAKRIDNGDIIDIVLLDGNGEEIEIDVEHGNIKELEQKGRTIYSFDEKEEKHDTKNWFSVK